MLARLFAILLVAVPAAAQSGLTGNWSGTYSFSIQVSNCQNNTFSSSGTVSAAMVQTGSLLAGRIDFANVTLFTGTGCNTTKGHLPRVIFGSLDGSNVSWTVPNDSNGWQFGGTVNGDTITAQFSDLNGVSGSLTMSRVAGDPPAVDVTGSWSGNYSLTDTCPNGATKSYSGTFTLGLTQSGGTAAGVATLTNVPLYDQNCSNIASLTNVMSVAGSISGSTFTGVAFEPSGSWEFPLSAAISGSGMSVTASGPSETSTTGTFNLTQSSAGPPAADYAGRYDGSYDETDNETFYCFNIGSLAFSGAAALSIVQAGSAVSGTLVLEDTQDITSDGFGDCAVVSSGEQILPLYGSLSGNALSVTVPLSGGTPGTFTVTFTSGGVSGTLTDPFGDVNTFQATLTAPPSVGSFGAAPSAIFAGQSATLSWATSNATTVTIDNGIGAQSASGSVTVSPAQTTVYTLTATGPGGTVTAQATVAVSRGLPRRRPAGK